MRRERKIGNPETFVDFGDDITVSITKQGNKIVVYLSHYAVDKTVVKCENVGIPGVIGPDVEFNAKDAVKQEINEAERNMRRMWKKNKENT